MKLFTYINFIFIKLLIGFMFVITTKLEKYFHFRLANKLHNQSKLNPKFYPRMALLDNSTRQKWSIVFVAPGAIEIVVGNISERARKFFFIKIISQ